MNYSRQREIVKYVVEKSCDHPTAEQVYSRARRVLPSIGMATVYRNLNTLADQGVIRRITLPGKSDRFDPTVTDHDHAVCLGCGRIFDIHPSDSVACSTHKQHYNLPPNFDAYESHVVIYGYCAHCKH